MRKIYTLIFALTVLLIGFNSDIPAAAAQGKEEIDIEMVRKAENWLNSLRVAKSRFIQIDPDGKQSTGTFYLKKPGRLRFQYDPPINDFILADNYFIYFYDAELQQASNAPLGQTLADFIVRDDVRFTSDEDDLAVTETSESEKVFRMSLVQTADPLAGKIVLHFQKNPLRLFKWNVLDPEGFMTEVHLLDMQLNPEIENRLFVYKDPEHKSLNDNFN